MRVTRQSIDVAGPGSASVQVSKYMVEALVPFSGLDKSASNVLNLDHTVSVERIISETVSNTLTLTQEVDTGYELSVASDLEITQAAEHNLKFLEAESELILSGSVVRGKDLIEALESDFEITQEALQNIKFLSASNVLSLTQEIIVELNDSSIIPVSNNLELDNEVEISSRTYRRFLPFDFYDDGVFNPEHPRNVDSLDFTQSVQVNGTRSFFIEQELNLGVQAEARLPIINRSLENVLSFSTQLGRIFEESVSSNLSLTQLAQREFFPNNDFQINHTVSVSKETLLTSLLDLENTVSILRDIARSAENDFQISHHLTYFLDAPGLTCLYNPRSGNPNFPAEPTLGDATLTLSYDGTNLVLRNPTIGNTESLQYQRINRTSRGGTHLVFADPSWPKQKVLRLQVDAIKNKTELTDFLNDSLGQQIQLLDHENRTWQGIITNPDTAITQIGREVYSVTLDFEGELL